MPHRPKLEKHVKPPEAPATTNPAFLDFANAGVKADEVEPQIKKPKKKVHLSFYVDEDINEGIEMEVNSKRTYMSKSQWIIAQILRGLKWKNKA